MAENFIQVYAAPNNLYMPGAPILIETATLLKNNATGKVGAKLKLKNINSKETKAVTIKILPFDPAGRPLDTTVEYQYMDLKVARDNSFGVGTFINIPDNSTRSYQIIIQEVVFSDNTIWSGDNTPWERQIDFTPLEESLTNPELIKQYGINVGSAASTKCIPQEQEDLWICACGTINRKEEKACHHCETSLEKLQHTLSDTKTLEENKNARLAAEKKKAEETAIANKKKTKKYAVITIVFLIVASIIFRNHIKIFFIKTQLSIPAHSDITLFVKSGDIYGRYKDYKSTEGPLQKSDEPGYSYYFPDDEDYERHYLTKRYYTVFSKSTIYHSRKRNQNGNYYLIYDKSYDSRIAPAYDEYYHEY